MDRKKDLTGYCTTATGAGPIVASLRADIYDMAFELPEVLGVLDAPDRIAAGSTREGQDAKTIHVSSWWRE